jgi:hypothetical protein
MIITTTVDLESRVRALEAEIAELKGRIDRTELEAIERRGDEEVARGQTIPVRQAIETLRRKYDIPTP